MKERASRSGDAVRVRLDEREREQLETLAENEGETVSSLIRAGIKREVTSRLRRLGAAIQSRAYAREISFAEAALQLVPIYRELAETGDLHGRMDLAVNLAGLGIIAKEQGDEGKAVAHLTEAHGLLSELVASPDLPADSVLPGWLTNVERSLAGLSEEVAA